MLGRGIQPSVVRGRRWFLGDVLGFAGLLVHVQASDRQLCAFR